MHPSSRSRQVQPWPGTITPHSLAASLGHVPGLVLLHSAQPGPHCRYSFVVVDPFLVFRARGRHCEWQVAGQRYTETTDPWQWLETWLARFTTASEPDLPYPVGGCFGYWGYGLKNVLEPKLQPKTHADLALPDCHLGFYDSGVVFDHETGGTWVVASGCSPDGTRNARNAQRQVERWQQRLADATHAPPADDPALPLPAVPSLIASTLPRDAFLDRVRRAQQYIRSGDIYQVNLSQRLTVALDLPAWALYRRLTAASPAPFAAYLDCGDFQLVSSSPELFLRLRDRHVLTRPIKGTRPRDPDAAVDAQFSQQLLSSPKENAELVMITDLLRNDLGRVCDYGSVQVPELVRLERYAQVQHLVSTVAGHLRPGLSHAVALAACFPGGSITGAPKFRAMEIIDELEPVTRGPYTGCLGYLGFNRESQLAITIRTALCQAGRVHFAVGAGIVADSDPEAEYAETLAKAGGFLAALGAAPAAPPLKVRF